MGRRELAIAGVVTLLGALALTPPASARPPSGAGIRRLEIRRAVSTAKQRGVPRAAGVDLGHDSEGGDGGAATGWTGPQPTAGEAVAGEGVPACR